MKNIQNIVFLFCLAIAFCSCHRDQPGEPIYTPLNPEFKEWCAYKQGSWWAYKELASSNKDSIWVNYYSEDKVHGPDDFYFYRLVEHITSANDSFGTHYYYADPGDPLYANPNEWALVENYNINQITLSQGRLYFATSGTLTIPPNMISTILDSFVLVSSGDIYYHVIQVTNSVSEYGNWIKTEYYARNVGVIRREMFNGEIWEVENFNIVQ
ncbi:hypothetical protein BH11BAC7_BH11BAC7_15240 [soil metagenome]